MSTICKAFIPSGIIPWGSASADAEKGGKMKTYGVFVHGAGGTDWLFDEFSSWHEAQTCADAMNTGDAAKDRGWRYYPYPMGVIA